MIGRPRGRRAVAAALALIVWMAVAVSAAGQSAPAPATAAQPPSAPGTQPEAKPTVEIGFEHRFRAESFTNALDYNDAADDRRTQFRFRTRLWGRALFGNRVEVYAGINNESRSITTPNQPTVLDEIFFEHLWADWKIDARNSVRAGRQNVTRGEGFVLFDANPLDGSRSAYFNAVIFTHAFSPKSTLELIAIDNPSRDRLLPRLKDRAKMLVEWDERAFGTYLTDKRLAGTQFETYYLHKTERHDRRNPAHPQFRSDRSLDIVGGRATRQARGGWTLTGEMAGQWGRLDESGAQIRAWGGYAYAEKTWPAAWKPAIQAGVIAMSGDDPATPTIEEWHQVFGRWPKWGEFLIYAFGSERGPAYWSNLRMYQAEFTAAPSRDVGLRATYYRLQAFHPAAVRGSIFGPGTDRGHLVETRLDFALGGRLRGHLLYEGLWPGDFTRWKSPGHFLRMELIYSLRRGFGRQ